ncbi:MAG TPA: class I SAM-dependent DNA methyltransferase, partial [Chthoniobacterales bacterium]|nr:class I SAM-dependent DNA methyltransferase [Chthoniobacterales bacterium]
MRGSEHLVQKLWNYCNILRDDGLSYGDYVEQLTFLLFLKMANEQSKPPFHKPSPIPQGFSWPALLKLDGDDLEIHYRHTLEELGKRSGMLGVIFRKAQNKIQDPAKLRRLVVDLIDKEQWSSLSADVKGDAYEGLLQKNAEDVKGGAGQYFTPRPLIAAMVDAIAPQPGQTICDPACGTGGFLLAAHDYIAKHYQLDRAQKKKLKSGTFLGIELVDSVTRLCAMNLLLHGIGSEADGSEPDGRSLESGLPVVTKDALASKHGEYDIVLANPPFGKKSSVTIVNEAGETSKESLIINRDDFWASTSNKQLNFLQHIFTILKQHGRAAVVLPDNVLFEGGAGETIRRALLKQADAHTLLRLPTGIFYAQGVKANVLFFDRKPAQERPWTQKLWIYDLRTNLHFTLKENTLKRSELDDFVACYFGRQSGDSAGVESGVSPEKGSSGGETRRYNRHERKPTWS